MPQIGWLEILAIVIIAIIVLGPKEFPIALKKIGSYFGKLKNTLSNFQREVSSVTDDIDIEKDTTGLAAEYKVQSIPHTVLIKEGGMTVEKNGRLTETELQELILS